MARFTSYDEIEVPVTFWVLPRLELHSSISGRTALRSSQREPISFSACFPASCPPSLCLRPPRFPLLFDEKIRPLFGARPASYREKLLVHCNVVTSSSHHSNLKEGARCGATAEFQCDDAESTRHSVYSAGFPFVRDLSIVPRVKEVDDSLAWISTSSS